MPHENCYWSKDTIWQNWIAIWIMQKIYIIEDTRHHIQKKDVWSILMRKFYAINLASLQHDRTLICNKNMWSLPGYSGPADSSQIGVTLELKNRAVTAQMDEQLNEPPKALYVTLELANVQLYWSLIAPSNSMGTDQVEQALTERNL